MGSIDVVADADLAPTKNKGFHIPNVFPLPNFVHKGDVVQNKQPIERAPSARRRAIEMLRKRLQDIREEAKRLDAEATEVELSIRSLESLEGYGENSSSEVSPASTDKFPPVDAEQFKGMEKIHAMVAYLKDRPG